MLDVLVALSVSHVISYFAFAHPVKIIGGRTSKAFVDAAATTVMWTAAGSLIGLVYPVIASIVARRFMGLEMAAYLLIWLMMLLWGRQIAKEYASMLSDDPRYPAWIVMLCMLEMTVTPYAASFVR